VIWGAVTYNRHETGQVEEGCRSVPGYVQAAGQQGPAALPRCPAVPGVRWAGQADRLCAVRQGQRFVKGERVMARSCSGCSGTGKVKSITGRTVPCPNCKGTGKK
jgi:hypothetical protein